MVKSCRWLLCALFAVAAHAETEPQGRCAVAADQTALENIITQWKDSYNGGDAAKVASLYTEDATYLTQHYVTGIVQGRPAIQAYVQLGVDAHYRIDTIDILMASCQRDSAHVITRYKSTNGGQKAMGVNLVVLHRVDGNWRIVAHEAAVPDAASAIQHLNVH